MQNKTLVRVGVVLLHRQWIKVGLCACATSKGVGRPSAVSKGLRLMGVSAAGIKPNPKPVSGPWDNGNYYVVIGYTVGL